MGFKSGDCAGQRMTLILCSSKNRLAFLDVCLKSLREISSSLVSFLQQRVLNFRPEYQHIAIYTANWTRTVYSHSITDHNRILFSFNCQSYALRVKFLIHSSSYLSSSI